MGPKKLMNWINKHEKEGHTILPADNPLEDRRGYVCLECDKLKDGTREKHDNNPDLVKYRLKYMENMENRKELIRLDNNQFVDDFSLTQHYIHFDD